ncbi:MAG: hypothetical protein ACOCP8_03895 [archaeon]
MGNKISEEKVLELFKGEKLVFDHYYKYSFYFKKEKGDYEIIGKIGGTRDKIYKLKN